MNVEKLKKLIIKEWSKLTFDIKQKDNYLELIANVTTQSFDDDVRVEVDLYPDGLLFITFVFDSIDRTQTAYRLINDFNDNVAYLKAFITTRNNTDYLCLEYMAYDVVTEENGLTIFNAMLTKLVNDKTLKYLKPLTSLTE